MKNPIHHKTKGKGQGWYIGKMGPYKTKTKAMQVNRAMHAGGSSGGGQHLGELQMFNPAPKKRKSTRRKKTTIAGMSLATVVVLAGVGYLIYRNR